MTEAKLGRGRLLPEPLYPAGRARWRAPLLPVLDGVELSLDRFGALQGFVDALSDTIIISHSDHGATGIVVPALHEVQLTLWPRRGGTRGVFLALLGALSSCCRVVAGLFVRAVNGTPVDAPPLMQAMAIPTPIQRICHDFISGSPVPHQSV